MKPSANQEAQMWLRQAEADFSALDLLLQAGKYDLVCFLAQQVAEKALKAFLIFSGEELIPYHSIAKLCELALPFDAYFDELRKQIKNLTPYYVEARYPNALEEIPADYFDHNDAEQALAMSKAALEFVKSRVR